MKTDRFTKILLTVIAVCLVLIVIKLYNPVPPVNATTPVANTPLQIQQNNVVDVRIVDGVGYDKSYKAWMIYKKN